MGMQILGFLAGLVLLILGAQVLIRGASRLALSFGISPLVVGLTVVAFGTSAPEIAVSVGAALQGTSDMAVGNVVGSNIFNILFILGISALITPLVVQTQLIRQEVPLMIAFSVLLIVLSLDGVIDRANGALLFTLLLTYTAFLVWQSRAESRRQTQAEPGEQVETSTLAGNHWLVQLVLIGIGLALLVAGSKLLVEAASDFARAIGISEVVIGLTIVAAGTSLPEVAASVVAALRGERDIAVGNVIGSNSFNILACLGISGLVAPEALLVPASVIAFDYWVMLVVALACLPIFLTGREIARWEGAVFVGYYLAYTAYLVLAAQQHDALPLYSSVMLIFVIPMTALALLASLIRARH